MAGECTRSDNASGIGVARIVAGFKFVFTPV